MKRGGGEEIERERARETLTQEAAIHIAHGHKKRNSVTNGTTHLVLNFAIESFNAREQERIASGRKLFFRVSFFYTRTQVKATKMEESKNTANSKQRPGERR